METSSIEIYKKEIQDIQAAGLYKEERILVSPQQSRIKTEKGEYLNFCANNYLGLANHPALIQAGKEALDKFGFGMASVRFICGTSEIHKQLEQRVSRFLEKEDTILYSSCFDANAGLFETLLNEKDAVISDRLNHASIIDGTRLCKAQRFRFNHSDLDHLETQLKRASKYRIRVIATDGVFSMDGDVARLNEICDLADQYQAMVMVDDSHATGFFGPTGKGSIEQMEVMDRVSLVTSTFGKALGGGSGGFTAGRKEMIDLLRQRSRPYLFSNSLSPIVAGVTLKAIDLIEESPELIQKLKDNTFYFRKKFNEAGWEIRPGNHPIIPLMLGDARRAHEIAEKLLQKGIYVIGFSYPVVPKGEARIRFQVSAGHEFEDIDFLVQALKSEKIS
ncbi:MAG: glycine C-acetyltransferase [Nitrospinota bacterium]